MSETRAKKEAAPGVVGRLSMKDHVDGVGFRLRQYIEAPRGYRYAGIDADIEGIIGIYVLWKGADE